MHGWLYQLTTIVLALTAVLFFWSTQAAWGRIELGADRYKVGLLGVNHISYACSDYKVARDYYTRFLALWDRRRLIPCWPPRSPKQRSHSLQDNERSRPRFD